MNGWESCGQDLMGTSRRPPRSTNGFQSSLCALCVSVVNIFDFFHSRITYHLLQFPYSPIKAKDRSTSGNSRTL